MENVGIPEANGTPCLIVQVCGTQTCGYSFSHRFRPDQEIKTKSPKAVASRLLLWLPCSWLRQLLMDIEPVTPLIKQVCSQARKLGKFVLRRFTRRICCANRQTLRQPRFARCLLSIRYHRSNPRGKSKKKKQTVRQVLVRQ